MKHVLNGKPESIRNNLDLAHRQVALLELAVEQALLDDVGDELVDLLRGTRSKLREALSMESARLMIAHSLVCGRGPL